MSETFIGLNLGVMIENETLGTMAFMYLRAARTEVTLTAQLHSHKMDNGQMVMDGRIKQPFMINITGYCVNYHELEIASEILKSREHYYKVTINGITWGSSLATELVMDQSADTINVSPIQMSFMQALAQQFDYSETESDADSPNRSFGDVIPGDVTVTVGQFWEILMRRM